MLVVGGLTDQLRPGEGSAVSPDTTRLNQMAHRAREDASTLAPVSTMACFRATKVVDRLGAVCQDLCRRLENRPAVSQP